MKLTGVINHGAHGVGGDRLIRRFPAMEKDKEARIAQMSSLTSA